MPGQVRFSPKKAFTLVELLVVVSIIALLISILLPSLKKARLQAKLSKCGTQLHDIGVALVSYSADFNRFPNQNTLGETPPTVQLRQERAASGFWSYAVHREIAGYMGGLRQGKETGSSGDRLRTKTHEVFYCPFAPDTKLIDSASGDNLADQLAGSYPDGRKTGNGVQNTEDVYLHISYVYYGGLHEVSNNPAEPRGSETKDTVPRWRTMYAKNEPDGSRVLMADSVCYWSGGSQWRVNHVGRGMPWGESSPRVNWKPPTSMFGANELFGDAHVENKQKSHFKSLLETPAGPMGWLKMTETAGLVQGYDCYWW